ncbi:hypothetical protein QL093DRAFT_2591239 [Fusarium oxysporum]|nr:hypothetical protein QL093DRAFT_2591239 [Fusarium oxysporum]
MANIKAMTGHLDNDSRPLQENYNKRTQLNTYIYEYFLHNEMFQCAKSILKADSGVSVQGHSPDSVRNGKGCRVKNALCNKTTDTRLDSASPNPLPSPNIPSPSPDSCFLYEWFCLFWVIFNAQKSEDARIKAKQAVALKGIEQNWPRWSVSLSQAYSPSLLHNTPDSATRNVFCNSEEKGASSITPRILGSQAWDRSNEALQQLRMQLTSMEQQYENELTARRGKSSLSRNVGIPGGCGVQEPIKSSKHFQRPALQSSKNKTGMLTLLLEIWDFVNSRLPLVKPVDANDSAKTRSTIPSRSQTVRAALPTPRLSKAAREKGPSPERGTSKKRTTNVKDEMVTCKIPKLNVDSTATRLANAAPNPSPHINLVGITKNAQNTSLTQIVPIGQPAVPLSSTTASMVPNPPVDLVQSTTFSMENYNDSASLPTLTSDL